MQLEVAPESATNRYTVRPFESTRIWPSRLLPTWISVPVAAGETATGEALGAGDGCALGAAAYGLDDAHAAQAQVKRMVSSSFSPPSFLAQKNLAHERVIPVIDGYNFYVAQPDWTDALLNRLAATRSAREIEPFEVTARISRLSLHIARIQEESFGRLGLNRGEVGVLAALMLAGPKQRLSPTQLFKGLMLSSAGITSRLDRLESRGYLKRTRHATDRRSVLVEITESGRKVLDQAITADARREAEAVAALSRTERRDLAALLRKLIAGLEPAGAI